MTLCTEICLKDSNRISSYKSKSKVKSKTKTEVSTDGSASSPKGSGNGGQAKGMSPKEDDKLVKYDGDVYETDSEASVMAQKNNSAGDQSFEGNTLILQNVLDARGYYLGKELGRGSFAVVHAAKKKSGSVECAIKVVDCSKAPEDFISHFFPRELKIIRELQHNNVIAVIDILKVNWYTCIVMERADQGDILDYLVKNGPMSDIVARGVFKQICLGLEYCHSRDIAHRDLKCENILLSGDNQVKLADFGFARYVVNKENMRVLSQTYCGSAAYAAPEVLLGRPYNPILSDIWSMGIILYVMINAVMPFDDTSHRKMVESQRSRRWAFHPDRRPHISPNCRRIVRGLLEPDITKRTTLKAALSSAWLSAPSANNFLEDLAKVAKSGKERS